MITRWVSSRGWPRFQKPQATSTTALALARKTLAEIAHRQRLGVYDYLRLGPPPSPGNGCGGFGVALINEIENVAAKMNGSDQNTLYFFESRLEEQLRSPKYTATLERRERGDLFVPNMDKVDERTMRQCLPNFLKLIDNSLASREEAKQRALEQTRLAKLPVNRLYSGYVRYSFLQLCNQVRAGYAVTYINDDELQRARAASKAIEKAALAEDKT